MREKTTILTRVKGVCPTHSRTEISVRDVTSVVDEPRERGGTNLGPTPTETLIGALIACSNVIGHKCAEKNGVEIQALDIEAEAQFDRRGVQLAEEVEVPFPKIRLVFNLTTPASEAQVAAMKADLARFCPLGKVIRNAGTEIEEVWNIRRG
jgi:uncharacterized OsmC-like protein